MRIIDWSSDVCSSDLATLLATTTLCRAASARAAWGTGPRPNIVTIVLDDVGYSDIGCFGAEIRTPAIDRLATDGLRYVHFDTKAVCASTREIGRAHV